MRPPALTAVANPIVIIPARMDSARLPGKPMAEIGGKPMILHVLERALEAAIGPVAVATDSGEIAAAIEAAGGTAVMTTREHACGTDRIGEALATLDPGGAHNIVVNLQGDQPAISPAAIRAALALMEDGHADLATLATIASPGERDDPNVVKLIGSFIAPNRLRALYFTRAAPFGDGPHYRHVGLYAFRRASLERFVSLPPSPLERRERLEQLRALEDGMRIDALLLDKAARGVDTSGDLEHFRAEERVMIGRGKIAYQGEPGANSDIACREAYPHLEPLPCASFEDAFAAVTEGAAALAMIPIENSIAGRVADIHHFLPNSSLHIIGEYFLPIHFQLMAPRGATRENLRSVHSHVHALGQCRRMIHELGLVPHTTGDTAGAAREVAEWNDATKAALAPALAAKIYGLEIIAENVEDEVHNTTRFVVLSKTAQWPAPSDPTMTSFVFRVRNVPAALYKALGGFATNGVNMTKLESYMVDGEFAATRFLADVDGHPQEPGLARALEELRFFSKELEIIGVYPAHSFRIENRRAFEYA